MRLRAGLGALFTSIAVLSVLCVSAPAQASSNPDLGVQFHAMWSDYTDAQRIEVLDKLAAMGAKWVRVDFGWSSIQEHGPNEFNQWYLDRADMVVNAARARGMKVLMTFWRTPDWANGGAGVYAPPTNYDDYGRAAYKVADYFKGRVAAWEVWNEPNHPSFWTAGAAEYTPLLTASYAQFKAGDPDAEVLAGSTVYNDDGWLRKMYQAGAAGYFDAISTHPYQAVADLQPEAPDTDGRYRLSHVAAVHDLMAEYGDGNKKIWFTEFGWSSHPNQGDEGNWMRGVTEAQQADFAVRAIEYVGSNFSYVGPMIWYNERNRDTSNIQVANYGLMERDLTPKPAYNELKSFLTDGGSVTPEPDPEPSTSPSPTTSPSPSPSTTTSPSPSPSASPTPSPSASSPSPSPTVEPSPAPTPAPEPPFKVQGKGKKRKVTLSWSGATTSNIGVYRNGVLQYKTRNDGSHVDTVRKGGNYRYTLCEVGKRRCSNEIRVGVSARRRHRTR